MMKKLLIGLITMIGCSAVFAQQWNVANQLTMGWDAVTTLDDGSPLPAGDTVEYCTYTVPEGGDKATESVEQTCGLTSPSYTFTFTVEGRYFLGVKSERYDSAHTKIQESVIAWSDDPNAAQGGVTFGAQYFQAPAAPNNLVVQ